MSHEDFERAKSKLWKLSNTEAEAYADLLGARISGQEAEISRIPGTQVEVARNKLEHLKKELAHVETRLNLGFEQKIASTRLLNALWKAKDNGHFNPSELIKALDNWDGFAVRMDRHLAEDAKRRIQFARTRWSDSSIKARMQLTRSLASWFSRRWLIMKPVHFIARGLIKVVRIGLKAKLP